MKKQDFTVYVNKQKPKKQKNKATGTITLYDLNKQAMLQMEPLSLSGEIANDLFDKLVEWFDNHMIAYHQFFMLLNNERHDYTIIYHSQRNNPTNCADEIFQCIESRGALLDMNITKDSVEIWVKDSNNAFVYYLFPYDRGVIVV